MALGGVPGPDAGDVAALFAYDLRLLVRVEGDAGIEVGEHQDEAAVQEHVDDVARLCQVGADPCLDVLAPARAGEDVGYEDREVQDGGGKDDGHHTTGVELHRDVGALAAVHSAAYDSLSEGHRYPALAKLDEHDRHQEEQGQRHQERELGPTSRLEQGVALGGQAGDHVGEDEH